jgi:hypothetical protein
MDCAATTTPRAEPPGGVCGELCSLEQAVVQCSDELVHVGVVLHYDLEVHNFVPNSISQAVTFIVVWEGFMGVLASWDLWVHLFRGELYMMSTG